jgi:hypothetical protein
MGNPKRISISIVLLLFFVIGCSSAPRAQTPLTTVKGAQGGTIVYGLVDGATTPGAAMAKILHIVQNNYGDKPQVGRVFRTRGSNTDAVFFTVTNRTYGNQAVAGMLIAAPTGPRTVEAALVSDAAGRFGSTMNPLLEQLFSEWHPAGAVAPAGKAPGGRNAAIPGMRQFTLRDGTGTVSLPAGWNLDPDRSGMAQATVNGPQGAILGLNQYFPIWDSSNRVVQGRVREIGKFQNEIDIPSNVDMTRYFAQIIQTIRAAYGQGPAPLKVDSVQPMSGSQGQCVSATGQINSDNTTMRDMSMLMCRTAPEQTGHFWLTFTKCFLPLGATDQLRATAAAIVASYKPDMERAQAIADAKTGPAIARMNQAYQAHMQALMAFTQQQIAFNQQRTNATLARAQQTSIEHDQQNARWEQGEEDISRRGQGFSNYILDQSVVQNNNVAGTGMVGHATLWNTEAEALVKADPNKYELVPEQGYWPGTDFRR